MLKLNEIVKQYQVGENTVDALRGVSIEFRKNEFVSILGPSGCGKTTLLNIIGGLDRYTSGDLFISGRSTKLFRDRDWDSYRNHSVGFVFQSYNLIPHQSVLANVELALTLSGVSRSERRRRAEEALEKVGLIDQKNKKPNQMSGGQMQRVAIARALVNDPEILLADEPTGALDSETSLQIMQLLKEIANDRLVIMVTHNPDLANEYSTRIIRLLDGKVIDDSDPYTATNEPVKEENKPKKKKSFKKERTSMSFFTALSLSLNNLMTKKGRTTMVSFAGSIGIIGIALILALSNGIQLYINSVQEETLTSYPLTIEAQTVDLSEVMSTMMGINSEDVEHELDKVYSNPILYRLMNSMNETSVQQNDLKKLKEYLDKNKEEFSEFISLIQYRYDINFNIYTKAENGEISKADVNELFTSLYSEQAQQMSSPAFASTASFDIWQELLRDDSGENVHSLIKEQYDLIYGNWPKSHDEIMVVVDKNNEVSDLALYALGIKSAEDMKEILDKAMLGEKIDESYESWSYEDICSRTYRLVADADYYQPAVDGKTFAEIGDSEAELGYLYQNGIELKVCGIIRPFEDVSSPILTGSIVYTADLVDTMLERIAKSDVVKKQLENESVDVITGLPFKPADYKEPEVAQKAKLAKEYFKKLSVSDYAKIAKQVLAEPDDAYVNGQVDIATKDLTREKIEQMMLKSYASETNMSEEKIREYLASVDDETLMKFVREETEKQIRKAYSEQISSQLAVMTDQMLIASLDAKMKSWTDTEYADAHDKFIPASYSDSTLAENLKLFGNADPDSPAIINFYASSFENKDRITDMIEEYNTNTTDDADKISYTDYIGLMLSSVTSIITAISYVLIAFVAISLIVSSIMIGIITYISVLERTKEIGVLRSIGASKRDVSHVFNAETMIIGFTSGVFGIVITLLLTIPINLIVQALTGLDISAVLPPVAAIVLIIISIILNSIAGLIPARMAAKKDPVVALRTE